MGGRRPLSAWGRAVVGAGLRSGLCQARIARMLGRSPSVVRDGIKRNAGADGCYRGGRGLVRTPSPTASAHCLTAR